MNKEQLKEEIKTNLNYEELLDKYIELRTFVENMICIKDDMDLVKSFMNNIYKRMNKSIDVISDFSNDDNNIIIEVREKIKNEIIKENEIENTLSQEQKTTVEETVDTTIEEKVDTTIEETVDTTIEETVDTTIEETQEIITSKESDNISTETTITKTEQHEQETQEDIIKENVKKQDVENVSEIMGVVEEEEQTLINDNDVLDEDGVVIIDSKDIETNDEEVQTNNTQSNDNTKFKSIKKEMSLDLFVAIDDMVKKICEDNQVEYNNITNEDIEYILKENYTPITISQYIIEKNK